MLPDGCIDLIADTETGEAFLVGTMTGPLETGNLRRDLTAIRFRPGGATSFLAIPARDLVDRREPLELIWKKSEVTNLLGRIAGQQSASGKIETITSCIRGHARRARGSERVLIAAQLMRTMGIEEIANELGLSRQHLSRLFLEHTGITPKLVSRIVRFREASAAARYAFAGLADLAARYGYADQSHMNRDFKRFAGTTASQFLP